MQCHCYCACDYCAVSNNILLLYLAALATNSMNTCFTFNDLHYDVGFKRSVGRVDVRCAVSAAV